jgi:spectinomycin phosphotransferase
MLEKPALADEIIITSLHENYGIAIRQLEFLPLGQDSNAWVYKAIAEDATPYFLKVRRGSINRHSLIIPRLLKDNGIAQVIAPYVTRTQALWQPVEEFALILYPFLTGKNGIEAGMTREQWIEYGQMLRQIHAIPLPAASAPTLRTETLVSARLANAQRLDAALDTLVLHDDFQRDLAAFWQSNRAEIRHFIEQTQHMSARLQGQSFASVICHADCHPYNLLITPDSKLWMIDWDEVMLAPKERDLMFIGSGIGGDANGAQQEAWFYEGYGETSVNRLLLTYYRYEWAIQDIADYTRRVFWDDEIGADTKAEAIAIFKGLFTPGSTIERARQTAASLPPEFKLS